ncbi:MAG: hypothetical protein KGI72_05145 [Patescibacteria group bacterium]|nr:hypothetical protein [Patescibacteria group bacterium]MDE2015878.1 hypothetical protein [Patescibacteria group bacterium]MDE2233516.1 hypothetical protein [Patescibacteria group bacterium]
MADNISGGDFGAGLAGQAVQTGQNAINSFNPQDVAGTQRQGFSSLFGSQMGAGAPISSQDYYNKYASAIAANPSVTGLYNTANTQFNVPQLANQAAYLNNQVANVAPTQYSLARGFDVSDPQVQNAINTNLRFLQPQATAATNFAQTAQNLAGQYVQAGIAQNQFNLLPVQQQGQMLSDALARQSTGFDIAAQNELQGLVSKMNAGVTLSQTEMSRANSLLQAQEAYQQAVDTAKIQQQTTLGASQLANKYQNIPAGNTLINTFTGGAYRAR